MTPGEPLIRWDWIGTHLPDVLRRLQEHLWLTALALAVGLVISLALALAARRWRALYAPITWTAGALYAIPSLALFAFLVPITGLSLLTAEIGLVSYTLLILTRAIVGGLRSVPPDVIEAATGMGLTSRQRLWGVEFPLALPVMIGGVRVATVTIVGLVTVTALIGQGGFGAFILEGIQRFFSTPLIVGALASIVLAVALDYGLVLLGRRLTPWVKQ
jgi:osmoprotectant transport system permease protein